MRTLYTIGIYGYTLGVRTASLFNVKAKQMTEGWKESFAKLPQSPADGEKRAWFHASSLGEFEQARPVLERFRKEHPEYKICVSFFSPSGYEIRKNYSEADYICYIPMDTPKNARRFVEQLRPSVAFFVKYDFWFNYLDQLALRNVPTFIFSAIFRPGQYFFKGYGKWFRQQLGRCFTHLFVQNEESLELLRSHGIQRVSITGDTRFDRVHAIAQDARRFEAVEQFLGKHPEDKVLLAGSSWEPDEELIKQYFDHRGGNLTLVLAPHVISESHITSIISLFGKENCIRYSQIGKDCHGSNPQDGSNHDSHGETLQIPTFNSQSRKVLIIDNIGMLSSLYSYADVAYIGGGFGRGIHNILEAITFGKPVVFGPNYRKFQEARDIISLKGGFAHSRYEELEANLDSLFDLPETYQAASQTCMKYLSDNLGSSDNILNIVNSKL